MRKKPAICDATSATRSSPVPGGASTRGTTSSRSATSSRKLRAVRSRPPVSDDRTAATTAGWCGESQIPITVRASASPSSCTGTASNEPAIDAGSIGRATASTSNCCFVRSSGVPAPRSTPASLRSLGSCVVEPVVGETRPRAALRIRSRVVDGPGRRPGRVGGTAGSTVMACVDVGSRRRDPARPRRTTRRCPGRATSARSFRMGRHLLQCLDRVAEREHVADPLEPLRQLVARHQQPHNSSCGMTITGMNCTAWNSVRANALHNRPRATPRTAFSTAMRITQNALPCVVRLRNPERTPHASAACAAAAIEKAVP